MRVMTDASTTNSMGVADVAARLDVHPVTVRRWITSGRLAAVFVGGEWRIPPGALEEMVATSTVRRLRYIEPELAVRVHP